MKGGPWISGLLLVSSLLTTGQEASEVIQERRALMQEMAENLQAIWDGLARGEEGLVERGAQRIAAKAARMSGLFPPGSFHPPSRAAPVIREEFRTFETLATDLERGAEEVAAMVRRTALVEVQERLPRLVAICRQCHRRYVQPY